MSAINGFNALIDASIGVAILIALVLLVRKPVARWFGPQAAYLLWAAPALRAFMPQLNILPPPETSAVVVRPLSAPEEIFTAQSATVSTFNIELALIVLFYVWLAVAFAWLNVVLSNHRKNWRILISDSDAADAAFTRRARQLADAMGYRGAFQLRILRSMEGPMTAGFLKPTIFLPVNFTNDYAENEQDLAIAHEFAHLARGDLTALFAASMLRAIQWPNPLVHIAVRAYRTDQEAACDAHVLRRFNAHGTSAPYASAIIKSARNSAAQQHLALALAHPVKERLMFIKHHDHSSPRRIAGMACAAVLVGAGLIATANYGYASDDPQKVERVVERKSVRKSVITANDDETFVIEGLQDADPQKIVFIDENGDREIKIFDADGDIIIDKIVGEDDELPIGDIVVRQDDGDTRIIKLSDFEAPTIFAFDTDDHDIECYSEEDGEGHANVFVWTDDHESANGKTISKQVICTKNSAEFKSPERRAEALRKAITRLEEVERRSTERRRKTIERLKDQLEELEKDNN